MLSIGALLFVLTVSSVRVSALSPEAQSRYDKGMALYEKQKYAAAQTEFEKAIASAGTDDAGFVERQPIMWPFVGLRCAVRMPERG